MRPARRIAAIVIAVVMILGVVPAASAAPADLDYQPFGNASVSANGVTLTSTSAPDSTAFAGLVFPLPFGPITYDQILYLGTEYEVLAGDCGGGSPRFVLETAGGNINVYVGPPPSYTDCGPSGDTGNLLTSGQFCDTSQIGGTFYDSCDNIAPDTVITGIYLIVDAGWSQPGGVQSFLVNPTVTIDIDVPEVETLCVNRITGMARVSDDSDCSRWEMAIAAEDDPTLCIDRVTGGIRVTTSECTRYEISHVLSEDGGLWACQNAWTRTLRAAEDYTSCTRYEQVLYIPAPNA